ncbi:hypothetical protein GLOIN_2v1773035 [Rhizophagus clarus]|uniref:Uncharacterized protein n=1 Tax=Rhizophagus clarus TaxID=94130 RepID=A0A8H3L0L4_9GLOM|nr:hypothetical protein GLOIN_2v1773035 [Rhizophagus clarus]
MERLKKIHNFSIPSTIHILSEEWIHLQFCSTNATITRAIYHTSRFNVKFKVQKFCIQYCQWTCLISADDKHKIPIREEVAVFTGVQNQYSLIAQDSILATTDHDFTKLFLTPSVIFFILIPNDILESFYNGQVFVSYKNTVFELSSAIRHLAEFLNALNIQYEHQILPPILCLYTDGGSDHRCNYGSVQIALICLFICEDFDLLIAVCTAPNHS